MRLTPLERVRAPAPRPAQGSAWIADEAAGSRRRLSRVAHVLLSFAVLTGAALLVDSDDVAAHLQRMHPAWLCLSLLFQGVQLSLVALRWYWINQQLKLELTPGRALLEYALSNGLNQLLPGGVAGDVARGYRQTRSRQRQEHGRVWLGVIADRTLGQLSLWLLAALTAPWWLAGKPSYEWVPLLGVLLPAVALAAGVALWFGRRHPSWVLELASLCRRQLTPWAVVGQLALAAALSLAWLASFYSASRALGFTTTAPDVLRAAIPTLLAASVPGFVNGWGAREGAAALAYRWSGLTASEGLAVSVAYGVVGLVLAGVTLAVLLPLLTATARPRAALWHGAWVLASFTLWLCTGQLWMLLLGVASSVLLSVVLTRTRSSGAPGS